MLKKTLAKLRRWSAAKKTIVVLLAGIAGSIVILSLTATTIVYTSTEEFCSTTCHEMTTNPAMEYKASVHDTNRTGVRAACPDCHVPHSPIPLYIRKMGAVHDLWGHFVAGSIDTREKFLAKRPELAQRVWIYMKENDSRECRRCHNVAKMDPEKQSPMAQLEHVRMRKEKMTCVDCHFAIAHHEPVGLPGPQELEVEKSLISKGAIF